MKGTIGFAVGCGLGLIALYFFTQDSNASKLSGASNLVLGGLQRLMSPDVAGVPDRSKAAPTATGSGPATPAPQSNTRAT